MKPLGTFWKYGAGEVIRIVSFKVEEEFRDGNRYHGCIYRRAAFSLLGEKADGRELFQTDRCCEVVEKDLRCCVSVGATQAEGEDMFFCRYSWDKVYNSRISRTGIFMDVVKFLMPRFFIMENVKEIVTHDKGKHLRESLKTALDHGYQARMMVLLADDFGDFCNEEPAIFGPVTVRDAISDLKDLETTLGAKPYPPVQSAYQAKMRRGSDRVKLHRMVKPLSRVDQVRISKIKPGEDWSVLLTEPADQCGLQRTNLAPNMLSRTGPRNGWWKGAYGRLEWNKKFKTIIASQNLASKSGTLIHPQVDRTITLREIARAQSFPDNFVFRGTPRAIQRLIGNAVPPLLAECIGFSFQQ
ncbi:uncharacterized protein LOC135945170 [Cloeon dipterum]|uniref:uncharacterized protein LOC135945170 n=1 Tax=Cloeon dipterum TaxID=197152 RepID=UPI003220423F